jgi:glycosyltransferase involved in cell wall biosynthesis
MKYGESYANNIKELNKYGSIVYIDISKKHLFWYNFYVLANCLKCYSTVLSFGSYAGLLCRTLYKIRIIKHLYHVPQCIEFERRGKLVGIIEYVYESLFSNSQTALITCGISEKMRAICNLGSSNNVYLVPNGISSMPTYKRKSISKYKYVIVSRLVKDKRIAETLELMNNEQKLATIIIGDGPLLSKLRNKYPKVRFVGYVEHKYIAKYLIMAKYVISNSIVEGLPYSIIEAMYCGVVPILSDVVGHRDLIIENYNGFLFNTLIELQTILFRAEFISRSHYEYLSGNARFTSRQLSNIMVKRLNSIFNE